MSLASAFWLRPDWNTADAKGVPFYAVDPLAVQPPPAMPVHHCPENTREWFTNRIHLGPGEDVDLPEAMARINDREDPERANFRHFLGLDSFFREAADRAARSVFGHRFQGIRGDRKVFVWEGQYPKANEVHLTLDLTINYRGLMDFIHEPSVFVAVFDLFWRSIGGDVNVMYDGVETTMSHRGQHKYQGQRSVNFIPTLICRGRPRGVGAYPGC